MTDDAKPSGVQCVWFKRDLRLSDHCPLAEAVERGPVLAVYIVEPEILGAPDMDALHWEFIRESLRDLRSGLEKRGGKLLVLEGETVEVLEELRRRTGFVRLWSHIETGNDLTYRRDERVAAWARERGVEWTELPQFGVFRRLKDRNGWAGSWHRRMHGEPVPAPTRVEVPANLPTEGCLPKTAVLQRDRWERRPDLLGGEEEGLRILRSFAQGRGRGYRTAMSSPLTAYETCSRLSPYLAWGCVSLRTAVRVVERAAGQTLPKADASSFLSRCHWHCHFMQKLESEPEIEFHCFNRACEDLRPREPNPDRLGAWCRGQTGYPFLDACMRSLRTRGWINFRMRAMLVSFAAYDLWIDWRHFRDFLARQFIDYEPGIHFSQIQMQSGVTGINTLRIYNPVKQGKDFDKEGCFIREWVPELRNVPTDWIHEPWNAPRHELAEAGVVLDGDYPNPVVDHTEAVRMARAAFKELRRKDEFWDEAERVRIRHGSRKSRENRSRPKRSRKDADQQSFELNQS